MELHERVGGRRRYQSIGEQAGRQQGGGRRTLGACQGVGTKEGGGQGVGLTLWGIAARWLL